MESLDTSGPGSKPDLLRRISRRLRPDLRLCGSSSAQQTAATGRSLLRLPQSLQEDLILLAQRRRAETAIVDEGHESCIALVGTACQTTTEGDAPSSWTRSVADIVRKLLALTGGSVLFWILASCFLTLAGMISIFEARNRSEFWLVRSS